MGGSSLADSTAAVDPSGSIVSLYAIAILALVILIFLLFCWWIVYSCGWCIAHDAAAIDNPVNEGNVVAHAQGPVIEYIFPLLQRLSPGRRLGTFWRWTKDSLSYLGIRVHPGSLATQPPPDDVEMQPVGPGGGGAPDVVGGGALPAARAPRVRQDNEAPIIPNNVPQVPEQAASSSRDSQRPVLRLSNRE
ncbi:hypothetical protein FRC02_002797 [Tulasnella sp. 418]|nr:hypothetical protein FRC02_002797 [Tulasnella sp. 418]